MKLLVFVTSCSGSDVGIVRLLPFSLGSQKIAIRIVGETLTVLKLVFELHERDIEIHLLVHQKFSSVHDDNFPPIPAVK